MPNNADTKQIIKDIVSEAVIPDWFIPIYKTITNKNITIEEWNKTQDYIKILAKTNSGFIDYLVILRNMFNNIDYSTILNRPTKLSDLTNDTGYITRYVENLINYYSKDEVDNLVAAIKTLQFEIVNQLPAVGDPVTIYLIRKEDPEEESDIYDEYIYVNNHWELIGNAKIDLSGYQPLIDLNHKISSDVVDDSASQNNKFVSPNEKTQITLNAQAIVDILDSSNLRSFSDVDYALSGKQETIGDLDAIRSGAEAGSTAYQKPNTGIPKTDLASYIQDILDLVLNNHWVSNTPPSEIITTSNDKVYIQSSHFSNDTTSNEIQLQALNTEVVQGGNNETKSAYMHLSPTSGVLIYHNPRTGYGRVSLESDYVDDNDSVQTASGIALNDQGVSIHSSKGPRRVTIQTWNSDMTANAKVQLYNDDLTLKGSTITLDSTNILAAFNGIVNSNNNKTLQTTLDEIIATIPSISILTITDPNADHYGSLTEAQHAVLDKQSIVLRYQEGNATGYSYYMLKNADTGILTFEQLLLYPLGRRIVQRSLIIHKNSGLYGSWALNDTSVYYQVKLEQNTTPDGTLAYAIGFDASGNLRKDPLTSKENISNKKQTISASSTDDDYPTSAAVYSFVTGAIENLPEPMQFKGSLGTNGTIATLPTASASNNGFTYKVITDGTYDSQAAKVGDLFISNGTTWILIPSGDEPSGTVMSVNAQGASGSHIVSVGGPITSSGVLTLGVETGYSIPSDTKQGEWDGKLDASAELSDAEIDEICVWE